MLIGDYFAEISRLVHDHETAGFIRSSDVLTEARSDDLGYLRATLTFSDHSELHVREYVRVRGDRIERLAFAYHYQSRSGDLRFRYDNAVHRPAAPSSGSQASAKRDRLGKAVDAARSLQGDRRGTSQTITTLRLNPLRCSRLNP